MRLLLAGLALLFFAAACAPPVSRQSLALVDQGITFEELARDPDRYIGRYLLLGGIVADVRGAAGGSELEMVELPTDAKGRITSTTRSAGRFIARSDTLLDPAVYKKRLVTVVGRVTGSETGRINGMEYRFPVLAVQELHRWLPEGRSAAPRTHFGIGIGVGL